MKNPRYIILFLVLLPFQGNAQLQIKGELRPGDTTQIHVLSTKRGDVFVGRMVAFDTGSISFKLNTNEIIRFNLSAVDSLNVKPPMVVKLPKTYVYISERLLISPTGFGLIAGEKEYRNVLFFYNTWHKGVTDHFAIGAGFFSILVVNVGWADAKVTFDFHELVHVGLGGFFGFGTTSDFGDGADVGGGIGAYGALTIGTKNYFNNFSVSRFGYAINQETTSPPWTYSFGGSYRVGKKARMFYEITTHLEVADSKALTLGMTLLGRKRSVDLAIIAFPENSGRFVPSAIAMSSRF